jgi:hypothetical protein
MIYTSPEGFEYYVSADGKKMCIQGYWTDSRWGYSGFYFEMDSFSVTVYAKNIYGVPDGLVYHAFSIGM